jgi:hypothetical protein
VVDTIIQLSVIIQFVLAIDLSQACLKLDDPLGFDKL